MGPLLNLNGPAVKDTIAKAAADEATAAKGTNKLSADVAMQPDGSGQAELLADRKWTNGWDITLYAKAWWSGAATITKPNTTAGVNVTKSFE